MKSIYAFRMIPVQRRLIALAFSAVALPASAQVVASAQTQRVEVVAPRAELRTVCPTVDADLLATLSRVARQHRQSAELDVRFGLDGRQVSEVVVTGGPGAYRRATQSAVQQLDCDNGRAGPQVVHLQVVFKDL